MDGDLIEIPSSKSTRCFFFLNNFDVSDILCIVEFKCIHLWKEPREKSSIFEPTPPTQAIHKVCSFLSIFAFYHRHTGIWKKIGRFVVTSHCLGSGSFATVHLAMDGVGHQQVACKTIKVGRDGGIEKVMKEVNILLALNHVCVITFIINPYALQVDS